jgi:cytoskeletal protein CcmA (bactofilin family)
MGIAAHTIVVRCRWLRVSALVGLLTVAGLITPSAVEAGCGCDKAPPPPATVRPHATYSGTDITIFDPAIRPGLVYTVRFTSGITGETAVVETVAVIRRDLADAELKPQLVVELPALPLGPTAIRVSDGGGTLVDLDDTTLTVVPQPIIMPAWNGRLDVKDFEAAVGRDGTVYVSLDMSYVDIALTFQMVAKEFPLRFTTDDVVFYNAQGFLMQLLNEGIPGLAVVGDADRANESSMLQYSRHEFTTYFLQHNERTAHAVDPSDPQWHLDGTPHIDHDHLIVAIGGYLVGTGKQPKADEPYNALPMRDAPPVPGTTPPFELKISTGGLFRQGIVGLSSVEMRDKAWAKSEVVSNQSVTVAGAAYVDGDVTADDVLVAQLATARGDLTGQRTVSMSDQAWAKSRIRSNGTVEISGKALVYGTVEGYDVALHDKVTVIGDVKGWSVTMDKKTTIKDMSTGELKAPEVRKFKEVVVEKKEMLPVYLPRVIDDLGDLVIEAGTTETLVGPGSFRTADLVIEAGAELVIDNTTGPVTIYVTGSLLGAETSRLTVVNQNPDWVSIYVAGNGSALLPGQGEFHGVVYAPTSTVEISGSTAFTGAVVADAVVLGGAATVTYDRKLGENRTRREQYEEDAEEQRQANQAAQDATGAALEAVDHATKAQSAAAETATDATRAAAAAALTLSAKAHSAAAAAAAALVAAERAALEAAVGAATAQETAARATAAAVARDVATATAARAEALAAERLAEIARKVAEEAAEDAREAAKNAERLAAKQPAPTTASTSTTTSTTSTSVETSTSTSSTSTTTVEVSTTSTSATSSTTSTTLPGDEEDATDGEGKTGDEDVEDGRPADNGTDGPGDEPADVLDERGRKDEKSERPGENTGDAEPAPARCAAAPILRCLETSDPASSILVLRDRGGNATDRAAWSWVGDHADLAGEATALCVYDESAPTARLVVSAGAPRVSSRGGRVKVLARSRDGLSLSLPLSLPLQVQLQTKNGSCLEASYSERGARKSTERAFTGLAD